MFSLMHLHPMVVHFPIAIILLGFLAEFLFLTGKQKSDFLNKASYYLMLLGSIAAIVTVLTGLFFTQQMLGEKGLLRERHEQAAIITTVIITIATVLRIIFRTQGNEARFRWIYDILLLISSLCIMYTGNLGGNLVY
ncbi:MAG TPA: DUF2231 domain-containing protein [Candidatus Kapabacteria bacterium]|nr:DUF2231 domain-containing protein [Candidatus Kapabacteria bacterium]HRT68163.1 DUF2231 domain-containing protein [Bacteroidota bacterium]